MHAWGQIEHRSVRQQQSCHHTANNPACKRARTRRALSQFTASTTTLRLLMGAHFQRLK
jgi:hypothetical protein